MNTRELLVEYRRLSKDNSVEAHCFLEQHRDNELFISLVEFQHELVGALLCSTGRLQAIAAETDADLRHILADNLASEIVEQMNH